MSWLSWLIHDNRNAIVAVNGALDESLTDWLSAEIAAKTSLVATSSKETPRRDWKRLPSSREAQMGRLAFWRFGR